MLDNKPRMHAQYVTFSRGFFAIRTNSDDPDAVKRRRIENGKETEDYIYERLYNSLSGFITDVEVIDDNADWGKLRKLSITVSDLDTDGGNTVFQINIKHSAARSLIIKLPNVDFSKSVELVPGSFKDRDTGRTVNYINIYQDGGKVEAFYNRANPLPKWKEVTIDGEPMWDKTAMLEKLEETVMATSKKVAEAMKSHSTVMNAMQSGASSEAEDFLGDDDDDDMPF